MWVAGALFSVVLALIWRLYDMHEARSRWGQVAVQELRAELATVRVELLRDLAALDREYGDARAELDKELARLQQRQQRDDDRWQREMNMRPGR